MTGLGFAAPVMGDDESTASESPYDGPYYLVFNASGGWDTTMLMDPKGTSEINRHYGEGEIQSHGA
ncbi:MAG: hypothetical protein AAF226_19195, partial [Verrucomicrobiota bacterium]